jgi:hypothetical protein
VLGRFSYAKRHPKTFTKSVIERLLSHSRKQAFAVLLHRQDSAHARTRFAGLQLRLE